MFKFLLSLAVLLALVSISGNVRATTQPVNTNAHVGSYNLILQNNLSTNSEVEGNAFIRGQITSTNTIVFGAALSAAPNIDAVTVVGDITPELTIENGHNVVYGGANNGFNLNGGGSATQASSTTLVSQFDEIYNQVINDSNYFQDLGKNAENGSFDGSDMNDMRITADETSGLNVINIDASELSNGGEFDFTSVPQVPVVINVIGSGEITLTAKAGNKGAGLQGDALASMVLWNFNSASKINFNSDGWVGSILAPFADITGFTGHLEGALAAKSFNGGVELHNSLYAYTPPTTPPTGEVPAPAGTLIIALGLLFIGYRKFKK